MLGRLRFQLPLGILISVLLPEITYFRAEALDRSFHSLILSTICGTFAAFIIAIFLFRRVSSFPGVGVVGHVLPAVTAAYGVVLAVFFGSRLDYSRLAFGMSFVAAVGFFFFI
jgi:hypothetical protein